MKPRSVRAVSFDIAAATYEHARPTYPDDAVDWLLPGGSPRVVDLGAGTGKFTRLIAARGVEVTAIEPSDEMRAQLEAAVPGVLALKGTAEAIPLADHTVDVVLCAQAWHWVDVPRAAAEVARVLKPHGLLGLVWNTRDERVDWVREMTKITSPDSEPMDRANPEFGEPFGPVEHHVTEWEAPMTPAGLLELVASRSHFIVASEDERAEVESQLRDLLAHHPQLAGRDEFPMPYVTYASRAHVR